MQSCRQRHQGPHRHYYPVSASLCILTQSEDPLSMGMPCNGHICIYRWQIPHSRMGVSGCCMTTRRCIAYCGCTCRYLISQHPEVEKKILAELEELQLLQTAQNPKAREMTYADLSKLTYLNAVIKVLQCCPLLPSRWLICCFPYAVA